MNRSLKWSVLMALALGSSQVLAQGSGQANALDLGQIQVKSALGQPLLAEIPLHSNSPADLRGLKVQLASGEDFARAGIANGRTSVPLNFDVVDLGNGRRVIRITSSVAVNDPYLDLLLQVDGATGKSVREFTLLLDPPGMTAAAPAHVPAPAPRAAPMPAAAPAIAPAPIPRASPATGNGSYGPVERGQTLSTIARNAAPGADVHQVMLAFKRANPDAFYRDNINALKSGEVLRVPTREEIQSVERAAAVAEVRRENSDWRANATSLPTTVADAATRQSASSAPARSAAASNDRLALVPASAGKTGANGDAKASAELKQNLLRSQESLANLQQQSSDLKGQLKELADINSKNERLLSLKDNQIAELQAKLAAASKTAGAPVAAIPAVAATANKPTGAELAAAAPAVAGTAARASAATMMAPATSTPVASAAAVVAAPAKTAPVTPKPAARHVPRPTPTDLDQPWYMQPVAWLAAAGVIVLLLLLALLGRRKKRVKLPAAATSSLADRFGAPAPVDYGGDDVDQNELLDQLAEHPDDVGLHLELVSLYYSRRDVEHFEAAAEAMHAHIVDPQQEEWQDVVHMGEDLAPGHPLFAYHEPSSVDDETQVRPAFDIDHYGDEPELDEVAPSMPPLAPKKVSEYSFNFQLTPTPTPGESESAPYTETSRADAYDAGELSPPESALTPDAETTVFEPLVALEPADELADAPASTWQFDTEDVGGSTDSFDREAATELGEFSDDPVDTKLDLARAYLDMGDADGARAMLDEVLKEGSQMQRDVAQRLSEHLG